MFSIEAKLAYDEWHKHAEQYNKLLQAGFVQVDTNGEWCSTCANEVHILYKRYTSYHWYCFECAAALVQK